MVAKVISRADTSPSSSLIGKPSVDNSPIPKMHFKGITVELTGPNGIPFAEYKDPVDFKDTDDMSHVLIELPPPEARQEFAIRYRVSDKTYFAADNVGGKRGFSIRFFFEETERNFLGDFSGKVIFGVRDNFEVVEEVYYGCDKETNKSFYTKPKFARIDVGKKPHSERLYRPTTDASAQAKWESKARLPLTRASPAALSMSSFGNAILSIHTKRRSRKVSSTQEAPSRLSVRR